MHPALIVEGHEFPNEESNIAPDGAFPPFRLFSPDLQDYIPAEFPDREKAEAALAAILPFWTAGPKPDEFDADNLPESYGFRVDSFRAFQLICKNPLIESLRIMANRNAPPKWVLWDPQDPAEGFMLTGNVPGDLRKEFADHARAHFDPPTKSA